MTKRSVQHLLKVSVLTSVTLQAVPAFALRAVEGPGTLTNALADFDEVMTSTDHVEFYWFPHTDAILLKCNTRVPLEEGLDPLPRNQPRATVRKLNTAAEAKNARLWHRTRRRLSSCGSFHIDNRSRCQVRPLIVFAA